MPMLRESTLPRTDVRLRIPVITGPTAVGKTDLALRIAEDYRCEILSCDSRQIFRELTIGTAKPTEDQLARVPHHFINERSLNEPFSAGRFADEASRRIEEVWSRNRLPLIVGGSTLYLSALQHGIGVIPDVPDAVRQEVMNRLHTLGADALYVELREVDPVSAAAMDPTKTQRLVRALEVFTYTGAPLSSYHGGHGTSPYVFRTVVLARDRQDLYARIDARTDQMLGEGLLDEVRGVLEAGFSPSLNALRTIGYREAIDHLRGERTYEEMRARIARNSRRYAKRQLTWFRRFPEYVWLDAEARYEDLCAALFAETVPTGVTESFGEATRSRK